MGENFGNTHCTSRKLLLKSLGTSLSPLQATLADSVTIHSFGAMLIQTTCKIYSRSSVRESQCPKPNSLKYKGFLSPPKRLGYEHQFSKDKLVPGEGGEKWGSRFWDTCGTGREQPKAAISSSFHSSCRSEPCTFPEEQECSDDCFGNSTSLFSSCTENRGVLEMVVKISKPCKDDLVWPFPYSDAAILKEDSRHCSH